MMLYSELVKGDIAFGLQELNNMYGDVIATNGLKQLRIAETEKYAHVTYFLMEVLTKNYQEQIVF